LILVLQARELSVEVGGRLVVEGASLTVRARDKVGLVGRNGAGKTSLLRVLGGAAPAAVGVVHRQGALGYLPQDPRIAGLLDGITSLTHVLSGRGLDQATVRIEKLRLAMEEDHSEANVARFSRAEEAFRADGGYAAESEVRALVAGLGIEGDRVDLPLAVLSGGERRRVELARILFAGSDVLLLDEPTNHLDIDARAWLMKFLRGYRGALLVISHDLELLDESITRVLHLDRPNEESPGHMVEYKGTYSQYIAARKKDEVRLAKVAAQQDAEIKRLSTLADKIRAKATLASKAHNLDKRADRIRAAHVEAPTKDRTLAVKLPPPPHTGRVLLEVERVAKSYDGPPVFEDVSFALERGERLLVLGLNGAGKTSLLRILAGEATADTGTVEFGLGVSLGYYAQEHEGIVSGRTLLDHMRDHALTTDVELRGLLGMFGLTGDKAFQDAGTLSGGEKTKLALAQLVAGRHNLLLLDEPTNNLDPGSRSSVAAALASWPGGMLIVSHDRDFVAELEPSRVLLMPEGELDYWTEDLIELVALA
jgi:ATPase subunit of ABC transporter with duplicated ATPase domains